VSPASQMSLRTCELCTTQSTHDTPAAIPGSAWGACASPCVPPLPSAARHPAQGAPLQDCTHSEDISHDAEGCRSDACATLHIACTPSRSSQSTAAGRPLTQECCRAGVCTKAHLKGSFSAAFALAKAGVAPPAPGVRPCPGGPCPGGRATHWLLGAVQSRDLHARTPKLVNTVQAMFERKRQVAAGGSESHQWPVSPHL
jgi:hypothetical protein